jgi:ATP-dependent DNA ligase
MTAPSKERHGRKTSLVQRLGILRAKTRAVRNDIQLCSSRHSSRLTLGRAPAPFSHPDWLFEIKWDGFRSLVRIERGKCRLISRQENEFKSFRRLNESVR